MGHFALILVTLNVWTGELMCLEIVGRPHMTVVQFAKARLSMRRTSPARLQRVTRCILAQRCALEYRSGLLPPIECGQRIGKLPDHRRAQFYDGLGTVAALSSHGAVNP